MKIEKQTVKSRFRVRAWSNSCDFKYEGEYNSQPSMTVPDQALSMREILKRFRMGIKDDSMLADTGYDFKEEGAEDFDLDFPDPRRMDPVDREALAKEYKDELEAIKRQHIRKKTEKPQDSTIEHPVEEDVQK